MSRDVVGAALDDLLDAAERALTTPIGRVVRAPGTTPAFDDCCDGQLYTRLMLVQPIMGQQRRSAAGVQCDIIGWSAQVALGVVRCAAAVDDYGNAPSAAAVSANGQDASQDMSDLAEFLMCRGVAQIERWQPIAEQGGCHGGEWVFRIEVEHCGCPD